MPIQTINPSTDELLKTYTHLSDDELNTIIDATHTAFLNWRDKDIDKRVQLLQELAKELDKNKSLLAELITLEMGKPLKSSQTEIEKCIWVCEYYAEHAEIFLADEKLESDLRNSYVTFEPIGVVLAVMPWNFPFWQVFRFAAPAIAAGNACLLKHASNVSGCALAIERLFQRAGSPANLFSTLLIEPAQVEHVIKHNKVKAVTLTGSTRAGRSVAEIAGKALKKIVLELGGSDPYLILEDADIEAAAKACAEGRLINSGQSCISAKRFIVVDAIRDVFEKNFVEKMRENKMGDPMHNKTDIGPLARIDIRDTLHQQVVDSIEAGATLLTGGELPEGTGAFYPPTVLTDVPADSPAYKEELFGPVAAIIPVPDASAAIQVANDSVYGLGSAIFSQDIKQAKSIARQLEAGCCFINDFVRSDPHLPFGGIKDSGYGRELSHYGIKEFVNIKTMSIKDK